MKVWNFGELVEINIGQKVFVGCPGSGITVFGEYGYLERTTQRHLVFKTESGAIIKTDIDNLVRVIGKADKNFVFVSLNLDREGKFIHTSMKTFLY